MITPIFDTLSLHDALPIWIRVQQLQHADPDRRHAADDRRALAHEQIDDARGIEMRPRVDDLFVRERSEEHTSELQSRSDLVCRLLLEKKKACTMPQPRISS